MGLEVFEDVELICEIDGWRFPKMVNYESESPMRCFLEIKKGEMKRTSASRSMNRDRNQSGPKTF